jgi:hypothetical protein
MSMTTSYNTDKILMGFVFVLFFVFWGVFWVFFFLYYGLFHSPGLKEEIKVCTQSSVTHSTFFLNGRLMIRFQTLQIVLPVTHFSM